MDSRTGTWLALFSSWKDGVLWAAGGLKDQPALYIQAMQAIDSEVNLITKEKQDEQEKKSKKGKR